MLDQELVARARALREVARAAGDPAARDALLRFADEYEAQAAAVKAKRAASGPSGPRP